MKSTQSIIVTGGAGFIGSHLVKDLVSKKYRVIVIDNFATGRLKNLKGSEDKVIVIKEDISNFKKLIKNEHLKKIDYVFHLAALPRVERSIDNPSETHLANVDGVFGMLELARYLNVKRVVFASSSSVYGTQKQNPLTEDLIPNPQNPYAAQKQIGEVYCRIYSKVFGLSIVALRLFNVYGLGMHAQGPYQLIFTKWADLIKRGEALTIYGDGKQTRDYTHVSDVVAAFVKAAERKLKDPYEVINIGAGRQISVNLLASLFKSTTIHIEGRKFEERFKEADITKARKLLGFKPKITIEQGVGQLLEEYRL